MFFLFRYVTYLVHIVDGENIYLMVARYFFLRSRKSIDNRLIIRY